MPRTNSKSTVIIPVFDSSQGKSTGTGNAQKKGQPPEIKNGLNEFDFGSDFDGGEPQPVGKEKNLGIASDDHHHDNSDTTASKVAIHFEDSQQNTSHDEDIDANSSTEHAIGDEPLPAPSPVKTDPGRAQPTMQLSDDPAIAALQKTQLAIATAVVLYSTCLAIFENAIADPQSKLPPNSFSYLRDMFGGAIKEYEARAQEVKSETDQLLAQHSREAKTLAAQAEHGVVPVNDDSFSAKPSRATTQVDVRRAAKEVKQLPDSVDQSHIIEGLQTLLKDEGSMTDADLQEAMEDLQWELENPQLKDCDQELVGLYRQLNKEAEAAAEAENAAVDDEFGQMTLQMSKIQLAGVDQEFDPISFIANEDEQKPSAPAPLQKSFDGMNALGMEAAPSKLPSTGASSMTTAKPVLKGDSTQTAQPKRTDAELVDRYSDQDELLREVETLLKQEKSEKAASSKVTSSQTQPIEAKSKPDALTVTDQDILKISYQGVYRAQTSMSDLEIKLKKIVGEPLTEAEVLELQAIGIKIQGNASEQNKQQLRRHEIVATIKKFQQEQEDVISKAQREMIAIGSGQAMQDTPDYQRKIRLLELQNMHDTANQLIIQGSTLISRL